MNSRKQNLTLKPRDPDFVGSDVAMLRASKRARQRAKKTAEIAAANKGSAGAGEASERLKREPGEIQEMNTGRDPCERGPCKAE